MDDRSERLLSNGWDGGVLWLEITILHHGTVMLERSNGYFQDKKGSLQSKI